MGPPRLTLVPKTGALTEDDVELGLGAEVDAVSGGLHDSEPAEPERAAPERSGADRVSVAAPMTSASAEDAVARLAASERAQKLRIVEAVLFAAPEPIDVARIAQHLGEGDDIAGLLDEIQAAYAPRGINLISVAGKWAFRTAEDLSFLLQRYAVEERRLSRAALETLSIVAYHQPVTRAEIEEIRGVSTSSGTIDLLLETGWIRPRGRRRAPGRPVTYGTTESFLNHFGLASIKDLPGLAELKGAGLLDATLPPGFTVPEPTDVAALLPDELPLDAADEDEAVRQGELGFAPDEEEQSADGEPSMEDAGDGNASGDDGR